MRHSKWHHKDIAVDHFLGLSTHYFWPADLTIPCVTRLLDRSSIDYGRFSPLDNENVGPVLMKLSRSACIAPQNLKLVVT